jgi:hypothetical protein
MTADLDDALLHYILVFLGMVAASTLHRIADYLGWDTIRWLRKKWSRRR